MLKGHPRLGLAVLLLILLLAFGLRLYRLGAQSLWYDEGFSVYLAQMDPAQIVARTAADIQPPLYYLLLHGWIRLWGGGEAAVRSLSLLFGLLSVPLIYGLAWQLFRRQAAGLAAAFLLAVSPVHLWYSQETRMYTLLVFLSLLSGVCLLRAVQAQTAGRSWAWWAAFALSGVAALYTHYYAAFVLVSQAFYALWVAAQRRFHPRYATGGGLAAGLAILLAYLPWLPHLLTRYDADVSYWPGQLKLGEALVDTAVFIAGGESVSEAVGLPLAAGLGVAVVASLLALLAGRRTAAPSPVLFLLSFFVIPLISVLALSYHSPKFNARYAMVSHPALLLLLGAGLAALWQPQGPPRTDRLRRAAAAGLLTFLLAVAVYANANLYANPVFARADFRGAVRYLEAHRAPDEAVLLLSGHIYPVFDYYAPGCERYLLPDSPTLDTRRTLDYSIAGDLNRWLADRGGVWVVLWQEQVVDPVGYLATMLAEVGEEQPSAPAFGPVRLKHYRLPAGARFSESPAIAQPADLNFGNRLRLLGFSQPGPRQVQLFWQALQPLAEDYAVSLVVRDAQGQVWGRWDGRPSAYLYPTTRWRVGPIVFGRHDLDLLPGTPPGEYSLEVGVYTQADPVGLDVLDRAGAPLGKRAVAGAVQLPVLPITADQMLIPDRLEADMGGGLQLLGWQIDPHQAQAGDRGQISLFWRATATPPADYALRLALIDGQGQAWEVDTLFPTHAGHPTSGWEAGQAWHGQHTFRVPRQAPAGELRVAIQLLKASGRPAGPVVELTTLQVQATERIWEPPLPLWERPVNLGGKVALLSADLAPDPVAPAGRLRVTLVWQALEDVDLAYTVFVHLLGPDGRVIAGHDGEPAGGARPTTGWLPGEYVLDSHELAVPAGLLPGTYEVEAGMYDGGTPAMPRLPVLGPGGQVEADHVLLGSVRVQ
jgi:4-amino-4-deoxy-L-arabinose transferase-like glycosyltransferase